jgi:uncharacterized protein (TIGR03000 family)
MYSVVLAMALTSGGDVTALGHGCNGGCYGCYGGSYSCWGGGHHGCRGGHMRGHSCCGCYGGGYYGGCYGGCYGGGHHGCRGGHHRGHGCCGYSGCGCYGGYGYGYGGCVGGYGGGYGMGGFGGAVVPSMGGTIVPNAPVTPTTPTTPGKKTSIEGASAPATLVVNVPVNARLTIDGEATTSTSTRRVFVSPALEVGRTFHYTLQAEIVKDGKTITVSKNVAVKAGEESRVTLNADNLEFASR